MVDTTPKMEIVFKSSAKFLWLMTELVMFSDRLSSI